MKPNQLLMAGLLCLLGIGTLSGCRSGVDLITVTHPLSGAELSAWGWVGMTFTEPMDRETVEARFSIVPDVPGITFWQGDTFWFRPSRPFALDESYQAQLAPGAVTLDGTALSEVKIWAFEIRQPALLYFVPEGDGGDLWRVDLDGGTPRALTVTGGRVIDFAVDRTGEWVVYSVINDQGGQDLWRMSREGSASDLLLDCRRDRCYQPAWSSDGAFLAYTREVYSGERFAPPQIWTVDMASNQTGRLYQSEAAFGHSPSFSPDGQHLASYDLNHEGIRFLNLETSREAIVPRTLQGVGDWSPDGSEMIFTDLVPAETEPDVMVYVVNLETETLVPAFGEGITGTDFSLPRWSPAGDWVAVSLRPVNAGVSKALWLLRLGGGESLPVADEPSATFAAYRWNSWGDQLIYQRLALGGSDLQPSLWLWDWESGKSRLVVDVGARPEWLP